MILSDRDIRAQLDAGRVLIEPFDDPSAVQPSSIDLRVGHQFRVFANSRYPYIDVRQPMEGLTELVEASEQEPFILHPGEFVLASTLEKVSLPDDLVARLEGKSSLGRLGLLIHSSLPADEPVLFLDDDGGLTPRPIGGLVRERRAGCVVAFDPATLVVEFAPVTGWYEGPADRIHEVVLGDGQRVRVTAGHNLFTLGRDGRPTRVRTLELVPGTPVAVPVAVPSAPALATVTAAGVGTDARPPTAPPEVGRIDGPEAEGGLRWDRVVEVRDTGMVEPVFDLEVRPQGRPLENFLAGTGGVFVSNTAGFIDAGWSGHLTLELSNVANLPITIYPGMKIGQLALFRLSSPAEVPYGSDRIGSKYQGQSGPTASRYFENFRDAGEDTAD